MSTPAPVAPGDLFGVVHDITRQTPIPPATTVSVQVSHLHGGHCGQIDVHGGDQTFLSTVLDRFGSPRYLGDYVQDTGVRVSAWDTATDTDPTPAHLRGGITITHFEREVPA